jgi:hypothetical protein
MKFDVHRRYGFLPVADVAFVLILPAAPDSSFVPHEF